MTSIHIASDLHLEFNDYQPPLKAREADVIILAGDIHLGTKGIAWARKTFPSNKIIYVLGNHEAYRHNYNDLIIQIRNEAKQKDICFLENDKVIIDDIQFLGCTLWTDYACSHNLDQKQAMSEMTYRLSDHSLITYTTNNEINKFLPQDAYQLHQKSTVWLTKKIFDEPFQGKTVVVTHHCPRSEVGILGYGKTELGGAFYSDVNINFFKEIDLWVYGHTHYNVDTQIQKARMISNQRGYQDGKAVLNNFNPELIINV